MPNKESTINLDAPLAIYPGAVSSIMRAGIAYGQKSTAPKERVLIGQEIEGQAAPVVAVIPIYGAISQKPDQGFWGSDGSNYQDIKTAFTRALNDPNISAIVFDIDSPGGVVAGLFDLVDTIYAGRQVKPVSAIVNEFAFSAAYAIASAAEVVYIPRTGRLGSVGVISLHMDESEFNKRVGFKYTAIYAGARKNDFTPFEPLTDEARAIGQGLVDNSYKIFTATVARNMGLNEAEIIGTDAGIFSGPDAVAAGLAHKVMPFDDAMTDVFKRISEKGGLENMTMIEQIKKFFTKDKAEAEAAIEALGFIKKEDSETPPVEPKAETPPETTPPVEPKAETPPVNNGRQDAAEIVRICTLAGIPGEAAALIESGVTIERAREIVIEKKAAKTDAGNIDTTNSGRSAAEKNLLIDDARARAAAAFAKRGKNGGNA
jgi:signal peptide peptidase SppA